MKRFHYAITLSLFVLFATGSISAQAPQKPSASDPAASAKHSLALAQHGQCKEALQLLRRNETQTPDKELNLKAGVAVVQCALGREQSDTAVEAIQWLNRDFPNDPEVLYVTTHAYSDLATRASLGLARIAPDSYQAHEMNAESLELQGKWDDAEKEYQSIEEKNPSVPGIHFRLGRLLLSRPNPTPDAVDKAKQQFEKELQIDPGNAGAEYVLGEMARQQAQWQEATLHFTKATQLDPGLTEAFLELGMSLVSDGKSNQAIAPLERYVKLQPANPAGHYQLAMAYSRAGRKEDAKREAALQRETAQKLDEERQKAAGPPQSAPEEQKSGPPN
jgi:tetratricopeptide (TPR) repeat protein